MNKFLDNALIYADLGYSVFPCEPGRKIPLVDNGFYGATTDADLIELWWKQCPRANIGIATKGLFVFDIDTSENLWLKANPEKIEDLAKAPMSLTARGGRQYFFRQPANRNWSCTTGALADLIDTKANGGYVVLPPSEFGDLRYRWVQGMELDCPPAKLSEPPQWLIDWVDDYYKNRDRLPSDRNSTYQPKKIPNLQRNSTLISLAGTMRRVGMSQDEIGAALHKVNEGRCVPPLEQKEVHNVAHSACRYAPDEVAVALAEDHWQQMQDASELEFKAITSRELAENEYDLTYLIEGMLVRGQPGVIAGPKKTLKTNISIDLALSLSHAGLFLGRFNVPEPVRVGVMSGESGAATIQETARRIAESKSCNLRDFDNVVWSFDVPQLGDVTHAKALKRFILDHELEVLILDPTYLMMMGLGNDAGNLFIVGSFLKSLGELAQETGCTPLLCHHLKKGVAEPYEPAELENIAWAGFQEFVRQWFLLNRRVRYDPNQGGHHELWMSVGGSAGHSGLWGLDIDEGTRQDVGGRCWDVEILSGSEAYAERSAAENDAAEQRRESQKETKRQKQRDAVLGALKKFPAGETPRVLRELAGVGGPTISQQLEELVNEGLVECCQVQKHTRQERGFRLI